MGSHPINVNTLKEEQQPKEHHQLAKETLGYKSACEQTRPQGKAKQRASMMGGSTEPNARDRFMTWAPIPITSNPSTSLS